MSTKVVLRNVILSYPHLSEAWAGEGMGDPKYRASFLFPMRDTVQMQAVESALIAAYEIGIQKHQFPKPKANQALTLEFINKALDGKVTFFDGTVKQHKTYHLGEPEPAELAEYAEIRSSAPMTRPPAVYTRYGQRLPQAEANQAFAGEIVHAEINLYPYNIGSRGIAAGLNRVIITGQEGAVGRLDGGAMSEEFAGLFSEFNPNDIEETEGEKEPTAFAL